MKKDDDELMPWSEWWLDFGPVIAGVLALIAWIIWFV